MSNISNEVLLRTATSYVRTYKGERVYLVMYSVVSYMTSPVSLGANYTIVTSS